MPIFDERIVGTVLDFANANLQTDQGVEQLMAPLHEVLLAPSRVKAGYRIGAIDWEGAQEWLFGMLPKIRSFWAEGTSEGERDRVRSEVAMKLREYLLDIALRPGRTGIEIDLSEAVFNVPAVCALAVFAFIVPGGIPAARLGKCLYRNCGKWFLRPPPKRGNLDDYCLGTNHGSSERVMRMRDKQAAARKPK